jgi:hypothetical protein
VHFAVQEASKRLGISPGEFTRRALDAALAQHLANSAGEFRLISPRLEPRVAAASALGASLEPLSNETPAAPVAAALSGGADGEV